MNKHLYSIIIVDDEVEIAHRIASKITEESGFKVVGMAHNGHDAFDLMEKKQADALLTDIHMPYVDGIELSRMVRAQYPKTKIAFISGYDEFEYAKEAIRLDVIHYLLKPIDDKELRVFLERLKNRLDDEYQTLFNQERLDKMFNDNRQVLIESHFNTLLHATRIQEFDLQKFRVFDLDLEYGYFKTGIIGIDDLADFYEVEYLRIFLVNLLYKVFQDELKVYTFNSVVGLVFILQSRVDDFKDLEVKLQEVIQTKSTFSPIRIEIGISNSFHPFTFFPESIKEAKEALNFSPYMNVGTLIFYQDIVAKETMNLKLSHQEIELIQSTVKFGSENDIHDLFEGLSSKENRDSDKLFNNQNHLISLAHIVLDYASGLNINFDDLIKEPLMETLSNFKHLSEVYAYLEKLIFTLREVYQNNTQSSSNDLFNDALNLLENQFNDPSLGMESASSQLGISVSYLSTLFKKNLDSSFNKELIKIRMEKAKELLRFSSKKIYEIAEEIGYSDVYYFSYSFKKYTLKTPKEFRNET